MDVVCCYAQLSHSETADGVWLEMCGKKKKRGGGLKALEEMAQWEVNGFVLAPTRIL